MKAAKKLLLDELTTALAPQLPQGGKLPKGISNTVQHLADQILRQRAKQEKQRPAVPAKAARQLLTEQLASLLDAHLYDSPEQEREEPLTRAISKTAGQLAEKVTKLRKLAPAEAVVPEPAKPEKVRRTRASRAAKPQA
ncbi:hypothetical protein ACFPAF_04545 [Hymenobacter endophyticus]|uniref:Uncharacterized protein n=1 Tax=Hymenobacter endophyticus TaxID=3076335 RepID=A0ABU3TE50_9BACT|nr:hypothetical protein [Hymenobacter endophyticus]MDU0369653.1 hypothetical protein [Hymenobacter endophyticus]